MNIHHPFAHACHARLLAIVAGLALMSAMPTDVQADDMKDSQYFTMSASDNHLSFSVLLTDLWLKNTWAKEGYIRAVSGQESVKLVTVYTKEMSSDWNENYNVFANNELDGAIAFLTNSTEGSHELGSSTETLWVWKGANNNRTFAKIDFYFPPLLAGRTWSFYYTYKHTNDTEYNMSLGTAHCDAYAGLRGFDATQFEYERTDARKIELTLPALPDDVPGMLKSNRQRVGKYDFTLTYQLYDGSSRVQKASFECQLGQSKPHIVVIPAECANFKHLDLTADVQDALYVPKTNSYFWNDRSFITRSNIFAAVPQPEELHADYLQFDNKVDLTWQNYHDYGGTYQYLKSTRPYLYRVETDRNGNPLSNMRWEQVSVLPEIGVRRQQSFSDNSVEGGKYYKYMVLNVPKEWDDNGDISGNQLESPSNATILLLGHVESGVVSTVPKMNIYDLAQDMSVADKVRLTWKYSRVPVSSRTVSFQLLRRPFGGTDWTTLGEVQANAIPEASSETSYTDQDVASNRVRYDYKVQLAINDGRDVFESDIVTAGVINGSTVTSLDATKGEHPGVVGVNWKVKQVGTDDTHFELFRRHADSGGEYMKIYATSGTSDSYSFDDNTVQPGYYYEYKLEAYAGDKASYDNTSYQNALTAIGFCQSTGSISGRVTFGNAGNAVGNVRLTLRGNDSTEGNMQAYSQRVDGATTGIAWQADSAEMHNMFGNGKEYTVQMFVRPDVGLASGSVVAEIPGLGRLLLGDYADSEYQLLLEERDNITEERQTFAAINHFRALYCYPIIQYPSSEYNGNKIYSFSESSEIERKWQAEGFSQTRAFDATSWMGNIQVHLKVYKKLESQPVTLSTISYTKNTKDTRVRVPANTFSLITLTRGSTGLTVAVGDSVSTQMSTFSTISVQEGPPSPPEGLQIVNGCLCSFEGTLFPDLAGTLWTYTGNLSNPGTTSTVPGSRFTHPFSVGGAADISDEEAFKGNLAEVRVWDHVLSAKEHANTDDRIMSGTESGLKLYWPMSEGVDRLVFDASYFNDVPNAHHGTVGINIKPSRIVPNGEQLSRYAVTNDNGEYALRGIPFVGSGSGYTLTPSLSIHEFMPASRTGFISGGSLVLNNYDFTDQSSFTVRGRVTYKGTNIPADSVMFKIDDAMAQKDKKYVMTDANGEYQLSVPIGSHTISAFKEGHTFSQFPADGGTYDFTRDMTVNFFDNTLVNVTGRINGGFSDKDAPLGFRLSKNRVGQATVVLSLGREGESSFNYVVDDAGNKDYGTEPIAVASATDAIKSTAYRPGGEAEATRHIRIKTDPQTGEFSALLPPLRYVVDSITFEGGDDYDREAVFTDNLPVLNATNAIVAKMPCDTLAIDDSNLQLYRYAAKMVRQLRTTPTITVTQRGMSNGAFGEMSLSVRDEITQEIHDVPVVQLTEQGYKYLYGHPIFKQGNPYVFTIAVSEQYVNQDTKAVTKECPHDAVVDIANEASPTAASIVAIDMTVDQQELHPGDVSDVDNILVAPDSEGKVEYGWMAGLPSLSEGYLRHLTIAVKIDGRTTLWRAPDSSTDALDLVVSGGIMTGNNFVTGAPDQIDMVLRRPPGSTSYSQWSQDSVYVRTKTVSTTTKRTTGGGVDVTPMPSFSIDKGAGVFKNTKYRLVYLDSKVRHNKVYDDIEVEKEQRSYTVATTMKTPAGIRYCQNQGDTYIGRASNLNFGAGRFVGLIKQPDGTYKLGDKESICTGLNYTTTFVLPQDYVENTLIPNWHAIIDSKLKYVPALTDEYCKKVPGESIYYTALKPGDYGYGTANSDSTVWNTEQYKAAGGHPSYRWVDGITHASNEEVTDSVEWANQQISAWKQAIRNNERDKLKAFDSPEKYRIDNYSIAGGTTVAQSTKTSIATSSDILHDTHSWNVSNNSRFGVTFNDAGVVGVLDFNNGAVNDTIINESITKSEAIQWQISDASPATALSVDVYRSPAGWGPIFRTQGGQTCNPYEGATYTKYYRKGTELDKATMRVENPLLAVLGDAELTDVPANTSAEFKLQLTNASESGNACTYVLEVPEGSNPNGAVLTIDGQKLGRGHDGRSIYLAGGETIIKSLHVAQSDRSITDYEGIRLVLRSPADILTKSKPVELSVHFIPASATIEMSVDHTVLNSDLKATNKGVTVTLTNLNRQYEGLAGVRLQYRRKGLDTWSLAQEWKAQPQDESETALPATDTFQAAVSFPEDGVYELRAQTFGMYGPDEVTYATPIVEVTQDISGPKLLGMPYPETGTLTYTQRNDMNVRFNEAINTHALSKSENFRIVGNLNNMATNSNEPDVALQLNGTEVATQADYPLDGDLAMECWYYRQGDGEIFSLGTEDNMLALITRDNGKCTVRYGSERQVIDTDVSMPENTWCYVALAYNHGGDAANATINALYAHANAPTPVYIVKDQAVDKIQGRGKMHAGAGTKGMLRDLALWNTSKNALLMYQERKEMKAYYTPGLVGYWRMDEGHGTTLVDRVHSANIVMDSESWYVNNSNLATHLEHSNGLKVDISSYMPQPTDNFAVEMWFRCNSKDNPGLAKLIGFDYGNGICLVDGIPSMVITHSTEEGASAEAYGISDTNYGDGQWHHLAVNVRRGGNATFYLDGEPRKTLPESDIPTPSSPYLYFGENFTGDFDDIRIWNAALTGDLIAARRYERLDSTYTGLIGYFPMEGISRTTSGTVTTHYSLDNFGDTSTGTLAIVRDADFSQADFTQADNAPALLPGSQRLRLDETDYTFVASEREVYFQFPDDMLPLMDGNKFTVTVSNVKDLHGNISEPIEWQFKADFALLDWLYEGDEIPYDGKGTYDFKLPLMNQTSTPQTYEILNLPTWLTVDHPIGQATGSIQAPIFTLHPSAPIGTHFVDVFVADCHGIMRSTRIKIVVAGDEPDWACTPSFYESNMTLVGQLFLHDKVCENPMSKVAAFDEAGACRGVASPEYMPSRDAYYLNMYVYGNPSSSPDRLTFRVYDASSGITYPMVHFAVDKFEDADTLAFVSNATYGSYDHPVGFHVGEEIVHALKLPLGWTWMSTFVQPLNTAIAQVLPSEKSKATAFLNIKSQTAFSTVDASGRVVGEVASIVPGQMYKVQLSKDVKFDIVGLPISVSDTTQTIRSGFNWIGTLSSEVMSPAEAFADLHPERNDMVKNRSQVSLYKGDGIWEGTLQSIVPGQGYIYESKAKATKTFHYPKLGRQTYMRAPRLHAPTPALAPATHFILDDPYRYADNMNIVAVVVKDGARLPNAEIGAFIDGECRGSIRANAGSDLYFLTIMGNSAADNGSVVELRVFVDGEEYPAGVHAAFVGDVVLGNLDAPFTIDLDAATGITTHAVDTLDDEGWYSLQGHQLKQRPRQRGVYIHKGRKVVIE